MNSSVGQGNRVDSSSHWGDSMVDEGGGGVVDHGGDVMEDRVGDHLVAHLGQCVSDILQCTFRCNLPQLAPQPLT